MSIPEKELDDHSTVKNDQVSVTMTRKANCQIKFDIQVQPEAVKATYLKALKNINKEVSIPGFRKGRAPEQLIKDKYQSAIQKEFVDLVLETGFSEAIHLTHLSPLKEGSVKRPVIQECSQEKGAHFTIEFETRPQIPSVNVKDLKVKNISSEPITEQHRQNALQNLLFQFTTYTPIEDRPVQENDFIDVSVTVLEEPPREVVHKQRTQVNAFGLPSWLAPKVLGLHAGESAEGMTEPDSKSAGDPNFQPLPYRITVHAIFQGTTPAVDEELVKRVGLQTVEELYAKINERLEQEAADETFTLKTQAIENALLENYYFDIPQSYIDNNKKSQLDNYLHKLGKKKNDYSKEEFQQIEKMMEQSTISNLQLYLLLHKFGSDHQITIHNSDLSEELTRQIGLMSSGRNNIDLSHDKEKEKLQQELHDLALDRKIKHFLVDHITFQD